MTRFAVVDDAVRIGFLRYPKLVGRVVDPGHDLPAVGARDPGPQIDELERLARDEVLGLPLHLAEPPVVGVTLVMADEDGLRRSLTAEDGEHDGRRWTQHRAAGYLTVVKRR